MMCLSAIVLPPACPGRLVSAECHCCGALQLMKQQHSAGDASLAACCPGTWADSADVQCKEGGVAIRRSIQGMLEELEGNLWEHCLSRLVDYGMVLYSHAQSCSTKPVSLSVLLKQA